MEDIRKTLLAVNAIAGSEYIACIKEAIILAINEGVEVVLTHNAQEYSIDPEMLIKLVMNSKENAKDC